MNLGFYMPTKVIVGKDCVRENSDVFKIGKKALIVTGKNSANLKMCIRDRYKVIVDRRDAIAYALDHAKKDDVIILAGKGQETYQIIGKEKHDFDERVVVYKHLNK